MIVSWQIMCWSPNPQWMEFRDWTFGGWLGLDEVIRERLHDGIRAHTKQRKQGSPGGSEGKESACNAGGPGSSPGSGRYPAERNGSPLQYFHLENSMSREAWQATVKGSQRLVYNRATNESTLNRARDQSLFPSSPWGSSKTASSFHQGEGTRQTASLLAPCSWTFQPQSCKTWACAVWSAQSLHCY